MPNSDGELSPDEAKKISERLVAWGAYNRPCAVCNDKAWTIGAHIVEIEVRFLFKSRKLGGASYPGVLLICQTCGNTQFLNALILEVVPPDEAPPEKAEVPNVG